MRLGTEEFNFFMKRKHISALAFATSIVLGFVTGSNVRANDFTNLVTSYDVIRTIHSHDRRHRRGDG